MDDIELRSLVSSYISQAVGFETDTDLNAEQIENLKFYLGEPFGNEKPGRSQVISRDVMDVVEWMTPGLVKMFHGSANAVEFEPTGPEDEQLANQATDYINLIYQRDNPGFMITQDALKDGLIQKLGVAKYWWEEKRKSVLEEYEGLDELQMTQVLSPYDADEEIEILGQKVDESTDPNTGDVVRLYDLKLRRTCIVKRARVCGVAPEDFLVARRSRDVPTARFVAHKIRSTRSELIEEGYDKDLVASLPADSGDVFTEMEIERYASQNPTAEGTDPKEKSEEIIIRYECYFYVDMDGDGVSELRKVVVVGPDASHTLENEEVDEIQFVGWSPVRIPHSLYGLSAADLVKDMQVNKSSIQRGMFDGLHLMNSPRFAAVEGQVNLADALKVVPGGVVRVKSPGAYQKLDGGWDGAQGLPMLAYLDTVIEGRTGTSRTAAGLNPDLLQNQTATAVNQVMSTSQERRELVARNFAEQFMVPLFKGLLRLVNKHQDRARIVRLRGKWAEVDPRAYNVDMDVTINVGLGTGNKDIRLARLMQLLNIQTSAKQANSPLVDDKKIYNTLSEITKAIDLPSVDPYFNDPSAPQQPGAPGGPQPHAPDPKMMEAQARAQVAQFEAQQDAALARQKAEAEIQLQREKNAADLQAMREKNALEIQLERDKAAAQAQLAREKMKLEADLSREATMIDAMTAAHVQPVELGGQVG